MCTLLSSFSCFFPFRAERERLMLEDDDERFDKDLGVSLRSSDSIYLK